MSLWVKRTLWVILSILVFGQAIRPSHVNPPANSAHEITADASVPPSATSIFNRSCYDCHSNRTVWPWYSGVAPVSWLVAYDVRAGRKEMNLSEWSTYPPDRKIRFARRMCKEVTEGDMPGSMYTLMHSQAKLTSADVQAICAWSQTAQK